MDDFVHPIFIKAREIMESTLYYLFLTSLVLTTVYVMYRRSEGLIVQERTGLFKGCDVILDNSATHYEKNGFPSIQGEYDGFRVTLDLVPDTMTMRKIPPLWLMITIKANNKTKGSLDFLVRPQNTEFYSPGWQWDGYFDTPEHWPQHSIAKYKESAVPVELLEHSLPDLFADEKVKQLLVTSDGLRVTYMVKQAIRGEYLLMRGAIFDKEPIDNNVVKTMLETAIAMRKKIEQGNAL